MDDIERVMVVTGGTGGIGLHIAVALARSGATVVVTGRDPGRAAAAVADIRQRSGHDRIESLTADLASQAEVHRLAEAVLARYPAVSVLVNNAGSLPGARTETVDGIEQGVAVNALAPTLLTHLLLPALTAAAPARVVNLSGGVPVRIRLDDLQVERRRFVPLSAYSHSKAVLAALTFEQSRRFDPRRVGVHLAYPGGADTAMTRQMTPASVPAPMRLLFPLMRRAFGPAQKASRSSVSLALDSRWAGRTGTYLRTNATEGSWPRAAQDPQVRRQVWDAAQGLLGTPLVPQA